MSSQVETLKNRILNKKGKSDKSELTDIIDVIRSLGCLGEIIGREFEIYDTNNELLYIARQKPIKLSQLNILLKEVNKLKNIDAEQEAAKWGSKKR